MSEIVNLNGQPVDGNEDAQLLGPTGKPVNPPPPKLDTFTEAIISLYNALTPDLKCALSAGIPVVAILTQDPATSGLNMRVTTPYPIRVDHEKKMVYRVEQKDGPAQQVSETSPVSPEQGDAANAGTESEAKSGTDQRGGEGPQG